MQNSNSDHKYTDVLATQQQNSGKSFKYYFIDFRAWVSLKKTFGGAYQHRLKYFGKCWFC